MKSMPYKNGLFEISFATDGDKILVFRGGELPEGWELKGESSYHYQLRKN